MENNKGLSISARSFITAIGVIFALMVTSYILTLTVPAGSYLRFSDGSGNMIP